MERASRRKLSDNLHETTLAIVKRRIGNYMEAQTAVETQAEAQEAPKEPVTLFDDIIAKLRTLPPHKQMEVRDFVEFLIHKEGPKRPRRSMMGALEHLGIKITEEDIAEARREMWGGSQPRTDVKQ